MIEFVLSVELYRSIWSSQTEKPCLVFRAEVTVCHLIRSREPKYQFNPFEKVISGLFKTAISWTAQPMKTCIMMHHSKGMPVHLGHAENITSWSMGRGCLCRNIWRGCRLLRKVQKGYLEILYRVITVNIYSAFSGLGMIAERPLVIKSVLYFISFLHYFRTAPVRLVQAISSGPWGISFFLTWCGSLTFLYYTRRKSALNGVIWHRWRKAIDNQVFCEGRTLLTLLLKPWNIENN